MDVLACLPPPLLTHLEAVLARGGHRLHAAASWLEVERLLRSQPVDVAVLDPAGTGGTPVAPDVIVGLTRRYTSLPVVVYTSLSPSTLQGIVELARNGISQVLLYRFDDEPGRLLAEIERLAGGAVPDAVLARLRARLAQLPPVLAAVIERLLRRPQEFETGEDIARLSGVPRRTVYRAMEDAGLASPATMVKGARLVRAYAFLRDPGYSLEDVVRKCGYSSRQLFARHVRDLAGRQPRQLRRQIAPEDFIAIMTTWLTTPSGDSDAD